MKKKQQWCDRHWNTIADDVGVNGICATILLAKVGADEACRGRQLSAAEMNAATQRMAPICCHIGEAKLAQVIDAARGRAVTPDVSDRDRRDVEARILDERGLPEMPGGN